VILNVGCDSGGVDPASSRPNTVIIGVKDKEALLPDSTCADFLVFSSLTVSSFGSDTESEPRLARCWDTSADGRVRTWYLRDDVRWQDGVPLTAHDVKFTFDLLSNPDVYWFRFEDVTAVDDYTVRVSATDHDYASDIVIYPKHLLDHLDPEDFWQWDFWTHPVGSGPYRFVRYAPERFLELEANPEYFAGKPRIERLLIKFIGGAGVSEALAGNVDILYFLEPNLMPALKQDGRFGIYHLVLPGPLGLYLNHKHPLFSDPRVRRAIALAIDRPGILEAIGLSRDLPLTDVLTTPRQFLRGRLPPPLPYDPEAARQLLEQAGWIDQDGDGVREKEGMPARFSLYPRGEGRGIMIQNYLERIGLAVEIGPSPSDSRDRLESGDFDALVAVVQNWDPWFTRFCGEDSVVGYRNPRVAKALSQALTTSDPDTVDAIYVEIQEEIARDIPLILLQPFTVTHAIHRRIKGLNPILRRDPLELMDELWIESE
jgi:peptide/nickel transport system substrate-binding protein